MELSNEFTVPASVEETWSLLTDLERIAPCLPGAQLEEVEGDEYRGTVKVKVGPITVQYKGTASFTNLDATQHKAVLRATGRDTRGQGNATATVTAELRPDGESTVVAIVTELDVTGKVAQFGRGMLADVSTKLLGQFADRLESDVLSAVSDPASTSSVDDVAKAPLTDDDADESEEKSNVRRIAPTDNAPVDLVGMAGSSVLKRLLPVLGIALLAVFKVMRRRSKRAKKA